MTRIDTQRLLVVRDGNLVRLRGKDSVRTVAEADGPVIVSEHRPWLAIPRSPHLVEVLDMASGQVIDQIR